MRQIQVERAQVQHIRAIAEIHFRALPEDFLPSLGLDFLAKVYYPAAIGSGYAATFVAVADQTPIGFITVAWDSPQFTRDVLAGKWFELGLYALRAALRHPASLGKCVEVFYAALFAKPDPVRGEIVFIALDAQMRGQGIGKRLVAAALDYLRQKSVPCCRTKTFAANVGVIRMYESIGWRVRDRFRLIGQEYVNIVSGVLA